MPGYGLGFIGCHSPLVPALVGSAISSFGKWHCELQPSQALCRRGAWSRASAGPTARPPGRLKDTAANRHRKQRCLPRGVRSRTGNQCSRDHPASAIVPFCQDLVLEWVPPEYTINFTWRIRGETRGSGSRLFKVPSAGHFLIIGVLTSLFFQSGVCLLKKQCHV